MDFGCRYFSRLEGGVEPPHSRALLPLARELQGPLPDRFADRLVGRDGVEPFGLWSALIPQEVNQTECLSFYD